MSGGVREIPLTRGLVAIVDAADYSAMVVCRWHADQTAPGRFYATRKVGSTAQSRMHREIAGARDGEHVDHINGNTLDNRRANLRVCTAGQNVLNARRRRDAPTPYKGVQRVRGKFVARIAVGGKRHNLGVFVEAIDAARAYDAAARIHHGEFARLNFPDAAVAA